MAFFMIPELLQSEERMCHERLKETLLKDDYKPFDLQGDEFKQLFGLPKESATHLCNLLEEYRTLGNFDYISPQCKILAALHFYTHGQQRKPDSNTKIALCQSTMDKAIEETTDAICEILTPELICFPTTPLVKERVMKEFQAKCKIPTVVGAIDCTHVSIVKPAIDLPWALDLVYLNQFGYYSIKCQVVTDANGKIISLDAQFPGSVPTRDVWNASELSHKLENEYQEEKNEVLLGSKAYPLLPWLMTPFEDAKKDKEKRYNAAHLSTHGVVKETFRRLKSNFRCLAKENPLPYEPKKAEKIIRACCTLHNLFFEDVFDIEEASACINNDSDDEIDVEGGFVFNPPPEQELD